MRKAIAKAMTDARRTDAKKIFVFVALVVLGTNLIIGALLNPLEAMLAERGSRIAEPLFYLIKLLLMITMFGTLGAAYHLAAFKKNFSSGIKLIAICVCGGFLSPMISALIRNFDVVDGSFLTNMLVTMLTALINSTVSFLILWAGYYFPYRALIKGIDVFDDKLYRKRLLLSAIFAASISAVYNLIVQTVEVIDFVSKYSPLYASEIASIIYDYVFVLVASALGALIIVTSRRLYSSDKFKKSNYDIFDTKA